MSSILFNGTPNQAKQNYATHDFRDDRCWNCDCRPWGIWASWPCGFTQQQMIEAGGIIITPQQHAAYFDTAFQAYVNPNNNI